MIRRLFIGACVLALAAPVFAATNDPTHVTAMPADKMHWEFRDGEDVAWPVGDPAKPGPCVEMIRWHGGHFSHPHFHPTARYAVVLEGTWWVSTSDVFDPENNTVPYPKGSVLTDLPKGVHYDGARAETGDAVIAVFSDCPLGSTPAEKK